MKMILRWGYFEPKQGSQELARVRIEQQGLQAKERANRFEERLEKVRLLGPDGACETCGQTFGDTLDIALTHYAEERDAAWQEEAQAAQQVAELLVKETALKLHMNEREQARAEHDKQLQSYDEVPGEITAAQRNIEELASLLAAYTPDELALSYDATKPCKSSCRGRPAIAGGG